MRAYCTILGVKEGRDTMHLCSSRALGMILRLVVLNFSVKARLEIMAVQFRRLGSRLDHINCAMQQSWEAENVHCKMSRINVTTRGLILHSVQLKEGQVNLSLGQEVFLKMTKCGTDDIGVNDDEL